MKNYIVTWTGSCQVDGESPEDAIRILKKTPHVIVVCSSFKTQEPNEQEMADIAEVKGDRR